MTTAVELALDRIDSLLGSFGLQQLVKADRDPLTNDGLDAYVDELVRAMRRAGTRAREAAMRVVEEDLAQDWASLTEAQRDAIYAAAHARITSEMGRFVEAIAATLPRVARDLMQATRVRMAERHDLALPPAHTFSATDQRAIDYVRRTGLVFMREKLGDVVGRSVIFRTRAVVEEALRQGLSARETARTLARQARLVVDKRSEDYFALAADTLLTRARTFSQLRAFESAGIRHFTFDAVMDERTCDVCRFLNGHSWEVAGAIRKMEEAEGATTLAEMRSILPFLNVGRDAEGRQGIYVTREGRKLPVARVLRSGVGRDDDMGEFEQLLDDDALLEIGACLPPLHGGCRCTIVPAGVEFTGPAPTGAPVGAEEDGDAEEDDAEEAPDGDLQVVDGRPLVGPPPELVPWHRDPDRAWRDAGVTGTFSTRAIRDVFKERVPSIAAFEKAWSGGPLTFKLRNVSVPASGQLLFSGIMVDDTGKQQNKEIVLRTMRRGGGALVARHDLIEVEKEYRRTGIGRGVIRNSLSLYTHLGVARIELTPAFEGRFVWPSLGFDWADRGVVPAVERRLAAFLTAQREPAPELAAKWLAAHPWRITDYAGDRTYEIKTSSGEKTRVGLGAYFLFTERIGGDLMVDLTDAKSASFREAFRRTR